MTLPPEPQKCFQWENQLLFCLCVIHCQGVQQMSRPACSPDMNPIEHAWDALGRAITERDNIPQTLQELAQALTEEWDALPTDNIIKLVDSNTVIQIHQIFMNLSIRLCVKSQMSDLLNQAAP
uniref:Tc1-like transposase DDE domain-containing protein n=1 Tax=Seriola lalandi dorsalis TaxID=1841481 RepID=A0A3B4YRL8_SERLL